MNMAKYDMPYTLFTWTVQNIPGNTHQKGQVRVGAGSAVFKTQLLKSIGEVLWKISCSKFLIKSCTKKKANRRIFFPDFLPWRVWGRARGGTIAISLQDTNRTQKLHLRLTNYRGSRQEGWLYNHSKSRDFQSSPKHCSSDLLLAFRKGFVPSPPHVKPDFAARQGAAMKFRKEEQNKGEVHACVCTEHLLQTLPPAFHMKSSELPIHYYQRSCWIWMIARSLPLPESQNIRGVIHLMPWQLRSRAKGKAKKNLTHTRKKKTHTQILRVLPRPSWPPHRREDFVAAAAPAATPVFPLSVPLSLIILTEQNSISTPARALPEMSFKSCLYGARSSKESATWEQEGLCTSMLCYVKNWFSIMVSKRLKSNFVNQSRNCTDSLLQRQKRTCWILQTTVAALILY